jgi:hypothetical protein
VREAEGHPGGYERADANPAAIGLLGFGLLAVILFVVLWALALYAFLSSRPFRAGSFLAGIPIATPAPRLQSNPAGDYQKLRGEQEALLHTYGWADKKSGLVRIPIERAMELIAERGLPARGGKVKEDQ